MMENKQNKGDEVSSTSTDEPLASKFYTDAQKVKPLLDEVSPSFCLAKWKQVSLHLSTGQNNSCYHPPLHTVNLDLIKKDPSALHNTDHKKEQRKLMLEGKRPDECSYCWAIEDAGNMSDRQYRSAEPWAIKDLNDIKKMTGDENVTPSYVEVNFSNLCNLKCSYCSPQFSSTWMTEVETKGGYPTYPIHNDPRYFTGPRKPIPFKEANPYIDAFWEWWPTLYPQLDHFRMTGGEPLMDPNTYKVFDYVLANPKPNLHLSVTSNFSQDKKTFDKYLDYVKRLCDGDNIEHFMQYVSIDSWGKDAEYVRHGLDFNLMWDNVNRYLEEIPGKNSITFIITMHNLVFQNMNKLMPAILNLRHKHSVNYQKVWFDTPYLRSPSWQSLQLLPRAQTDYFIPILDWMKKSIETEQTRFHGFKDYEIQRLQRVFDWSKEHLKEEDRVINMANFYMFFSEQDIRHGTNFLKTFPTMRQFWEDCKFYATHK